MKSGTYDNIKLQRREWWYNNKLVYIRPAICCQIFPVYPDTPCDQRWRNGWRKNAKR